MIWGKRKITSSFRPGWGVLPYKRLTGCALGWGRIFNRGQTITGWRFQQSYQNGVAHFLIFGVRQFFIFTVSKRTRMFVLQVKNKVFFIQCKVRTYQKVTKLGSRKLRFCPKVTKMWSIIGYRINYNGVGTLRGQRHIPSKNYPKYPPGVKVFNSFDVHSKYIVAFPISVKTSASSNNILNLLYLL